MHLHVEVEKASQNNSTTTAFLKKKLGKHILLPSGNNRHNCAPPLTLTPAFGEKLCKQIQVGLMKKVFLPCCEMLLYLNYIVSFSSLFFLPP